MNCQDITRFADSGSFSRLTEAERREAEAHALGCPHCAPVWATHVRMAELRIPPMPAEFSVRVRTMVAVRMQTQGRPALRRLTLIGSVMALAAAAGLLAVHLADRRVPERKQAAVAVAPASTPAPSLAAPEVTVPVVRKAAPLPKAPAEVAATETAKPQPAEPLPLLPPPVYQSAAERNAQVDLALQKAAEQHPELVEGPETDGTFAVGVVMREDGTLLGSTVKLATRADLRDVYAEVERTLPRDGGGSTSGGYPKHKLLPNGRSLRADTSFRVAVVSMSYDLTRSNVRVQQMLGDKYADQLRPASGADLNRLTVFLSEDGSILRAKLDSMNTQGSRTMSGGDPNDALYLARTISDRLELDVTQIGLMGVTTLEEGSLVFTLDSNGQTRPDDQRRLLPVYYAWQRRAGESGASYGQSSGRATTQSTINLTAALAVVERLIPDAFTRKDPAAGEPTVVLTTKGELIRAGRVDYRKGGAMDTLTQQLVPGVRTSSFLSVRLRNNLGETADVQFAWEMPAEMAKAMDDAMQKAREKAAGPAN